MRFSLGNNIRIPGYWKVTMFRCLVECFLEGLTNYSKHLMIRYLFSGEGVGWESERRVVGCRNKGKK